MVGVSHGACPAILQGDLNMLRNITDKLRQKCAFGSRGLINKIDFDPDILHSFNRVNSDVTW
jgi:hypothetical protein